MKKLLAGCLVALSLSACGLPMEGEEGYVPETGSNQQAMHNREVFAPNTNGSAPTLKALPNPLAAAEAPLAWKNPDVQNVMRGGDGCH